MVKTMKRLAVAAALTLSASAGAQEIKFGAMPLNTWWYVAGASVAALVQPQLPAGARIEVLARGGGIANPVVVNENKAQVGMSNVATSKWAWDGEPELYKGKKHQDIRALVGGINSIYIVAMLREDYIQRTGNDTVEKALADRNIRIIMKPAGSSVPPAARMIAESLGTSLEKIRSGGAQIIQVDAAQTTSMLREGRADLYFETAAKGHPAVTEVTITTPMRFVDLPEKALKAMTDRGLRPTSMPEWFKGQKGPTKSVDLGTHIIAHKDVPENIAYIVTKTIVENKDKLVERHQAWGDFKPEDAWKPENNAIPLHPGAAKYYRERGWLKG
ncbi:MAG TPA: TAXI family TRAP transporter solute-binding subunit [Burkholderiales bacterium]|nr:TAXI family TRAP transporter solute-binding subunit [Burkholderiales bacterium]